MGNGRGYNYDRRDGPISVEWFKGAKTNVCYNCVDRHLESRADKTAIIWEEMNRERMQLSLIVNCMSRYPDLPMC